MQGAQAAIWIRQVMQHPGANYQVETASQFLDALQRQLMQFEIF